MREHRLQDPLGHIAETEVGGIVGEHTLSLNCIRSPASLNSDEMVVGLAIVWVSHIGHHCA
jgi:hypothetical protein